MLVSIAYRVMHAPWSDRQQWLAAIMARVPTARVIRDEQRDLWDTARRAWLDGASSGATHVMVLQDDMIPVDDFEAQISPRQPSRSLLFRPVTGLRRTATGAIDCPDGGTAVRTSGAALCVFLRTACAIWSTSAT
jgi:hypothetical protein